MTQDQSSIPAGICQCGCGETTKLAPRTVARFGYVKGEPYAWVRGHAHRLPAIPYLGDGLCFCGCGRQTEIETRGGRGIPKGHPRRFLKGHFGADSGKRKAQRYTVEDRGYETPCWIWQLATNAFGYGTTNRGLAHRVEYEIGTGPIPEGLELDHLCNVRACVNPAHLEPVTHAENHRRSVARGAYIGKTHDMKRCALGRFVKKAATDG